MNILFVESTAFSEKVDSFLNEDEQDGLRFLLAAKPLSGKPSAANENILEILFAHCYVSYAIDSSGTAIYLLDIRDAPTPAPLPEEKAKLKEKIEKFLAALVIRDLLRKARDWLEEHWPDWDDYF